MIPALSRASSNTTWLIVSTTLVQEPGSASDTRHTHTRTLRKKWGEPFPRCLAKRTMRVFLATESHYFCVGIFTCVQPSKELRRSRLANTDNGSTWRQDCLLQISPRREIPHTRAASSHRHIVQGERIRPTNIRQIRREDRTFLQLSFTQFPTTELTVSSYGTPRSKV